MFISITMHVQMNMHTDIFSLCNLITFDLITLITYDLNTLIIYDLIT